MTSKKERRSEGHSSNPPQKLYQAHKKTNKDPRREMLQRLAYIRGRAEGGLERQALAESAISGEEVDIVYPRVFVEKEGKLPFSYLLPTFPASFSSPVRFFAGGRIRKGVRRFCSGFLHPGQVLRYARGHYEGRRVERRASWTGEAWYETFLTSQRSSLKPNPKRRFSIDTGQRTQSDPRRRVPKKLHWSSLSVSPKKSMRGLPPMITFSSWEGLEQVLVPFVFLLFFL
jgi:hypothetical protein